MLPVDRNLDGDANIDSRTAAALRRRSRTAAASAFALSVGLMSLGISTGRTAMSSASTVLPDAVGASSRLPEPPTGAVRVGSPSTVWSIRPSSRSSQDDRDRVRSDLLGLRQFNGRPVRAAYTLRMRVTAYSPDARSCGDSADGITASGYSVFTNGGALVAADPRVLPMGCIVSVPGYDGGSVVPVLDVGGAIKGNRLDVLYPTHEAAMQWGVRDLEVTVWEYADGLPNGFKRLRRPAQ